MYLKFHVNIFTGFSRDIQEELKFWEISLMKKRDIIMPKYISELSYLAHGISLSPFKYNNSCTGFRDVQGKKRNGTDAQTEEMKSIYVLLVQNVVTC